MTLVKKKKALPEALEKFKFKPGQTGNPLGRQTNPVKRALRNITLESYREVLEVVLQEDMHALKAMCDDQENSALKLGVARAFFKACKTGDYGIIERIAERIIGKIPDEINIRSKNQTLNLNAEIDKEKIKATIAELESNV